MKAELINKVACPVCYGKVSLAEQGNEIICQPCQLAYPIQEGIPVMLAVEARSLSSTQGTQQITEA